MNIQVKQSFYSDAPTPISKDAYALLNFFQVKYKTLSSKEKILCINI
jgi:hypothetical protein